MHQGVTGQDVSSYLVKECARWNYLKRDQGVQYMKHWIKNLVLVLPEDCISLKGLSHIKNIKLLGLLLFTKNKS